MARAAQHAGAAVDQSGPGETLRIYLRQELGKLGILDDSQLERLMPKQAESGAFALLTAKTHNHAYTDRVAGAKPELAPLVPPCGLVQKNAWTWLIQNWSTLVCRSQV
jgi:hypothetical protein